MVRNDGARGQAIASGVRVYSRPFDSGSADGVRKTILITLGRLPKALDLVRGFAACGHRVIVAEPFRWHLCRPSHHVERSYQVTAPRQDSLRYRDDLLRIIDVEKVDWVVPVSEEIMHVATLHGHLPKQVTLFAPPLQVLLGLHDKLAFIRQAASYGLRVPTTYSLEDPAAAGLAHSADYVIKPLFSCSGKGVRILPQGTPLSTEAAAVPCLIQSFVKGGVHSTFSLAHAGRVLVTAVYRGTIMSGTVAVGFERVEVPAITAWVETFVARCKHSGFISFDFVVDADGTALAIECNPRVTSGVHFVEERDLAEAILDPEAAAPIRFRPQFLFQQFYPCLTETQKAMFRPGDRARHLHYLRAARDVVWRGDDPLPFLTMTFTSYQILAMNIFQGLSLGEAATRDIEWQAAAGA